MIIFQNCTSLAIIFNNHYNMRNNFRQLKSSKPGSTTTRAPSSCAAGTELSLEGSGPKGGWRDAINSIGPWGVDQFASRQSTSLQGSKKNTNSHNRLVHLAVGSHRSKQNAGKEQTLAIISNNEGQRMQRRQRNKTEGEEMECKSGTRVTTIEVSNNLHMVASQKYFSEECSQRKMSMHKLRETLLKTSRTRTTTTTNTTTNAHTNAHMDMGHSKYETGRKLDPTLAAMAVSKRLRTIESENAWPLLFFFQAKNSRNMMQREKNIIKIRGGGRAKRIQTEGGGATTH